MFRSQSILRSEHRHPQSCNEAYVEKLMDTGSSKNVTTSVIPEDAGFDALRWILRSIYQALHFAFFDVYDFYLVGYGRRFASVRAKLSGISSISFSSQEEYIYIYIYHRAHTSYRHHCEVQKGFPPSRQICP